MQILILIPLYAKLIPFPHFPPTHLPTPLHHNQTLNLLLFKFLDLACQHSKTLLKQGLGIWDLWSCASASESTILCFCISLLNMRSREEAGVISCLHFVSQRSRWGYGETKLPAITSAARRQKCREIGFHENTFPTKTKYFFNIILRQNIMSVGSSKFFKTEVKHNFKLGN